MVRPSLRTISWIAIATIVVTFATRMFAQTVIENSAEARFQLDLHVPDAAVNAMLPSGFTMNVAPQGPAKDCNLRAIFVDRMTINGADGKPAGKGSARFVYLGRMLTDWIPQSALRQFRVRFTAITHVHDRVICTGRIVERVERGGEQLARVEIEARTHHGAVTLTGEAWVAI